jgi:hypothetical protein
MNILLRCFTKPGSYFLFLFSFLLFNIYAVAQSTCVNTANVNACTGGNVSQNFSTGDGNFYSASFAYSAGNGRWELNNPNFFTTYSLNSSNYSLAMNGVARVGFIFGRSRGSCNLSAAGFQIAVINNLTNQVLAQCNSVSFNAGNVVCANISDVDLIAGTPVHFVISFRMRPLCISSSFYIDDFSVGNSAIAVPVPVTLTSFTAKRKDNSVKLDWQTSSEFNNSGFQIERKLEGEEGFQTIAFVPSLKKDGNSNDVLNYSYSDMNISGDASQYQLKQIDFDGKYKYSDVLVVKGTSASGRILIYPNPATQGTVNVIFDSFNKKSIQLTDINGRMQRKWEGYTSGQLQLKQLHPGIYLLNVTDQGTNTKLIRKIVVL